MLQTCISYPPINAAENNSAKSSIKSSSSISTSSIFIRIHAFLLSNHTNLVTQTASQLVSCYSDCGYIFPCIPRAITGTILVDLVHILYEYLGMLHTPHPLRPHIHCNNVSQLEAHNLLKNWFVVVGKVSLWNMSMNIQSKCQTSLGHRLQAEGLEEWLSAGDTNLPKDVFAVNLKVHIRWRDQTRLLCKLIHLLLTVPKPPILCPSWSLPCK